jgi:hypothetical protein
MKLSSRDQITISVAIFLALSLLLTFAAHMAGPQTHENEVALATEGVKVVGNITKKEQRFGGILFGPKLTWWLYLSYTTQTGAVHDRTLYVSETVYDRVEIGPIPVTYIRSNPRIFYADGITHEPTDADIAITDAMFFYGAIVSAALGLALAGLLVTRGGGGSPAARGAASSRSAARPLPSAGRQPGEFGTRRRAP